MIEQERLISQPHGLLSMLGVLLTLLCLNDNEKEFVICVKQGVPDFSEFGDVYEFGFGQGQDKPPTSALIKKEFQRKIFYPLSPYEDSTLAAMLLRPGPIQALTSARFTEEEGEVEKVPRVFIKTMQDKAVKPEQQDAMIKRWPPSTVYELDTDHSPFFSDPFLLVGILVKAAAFDGAPSCTS